MTAFLSASLSDYLFHTTADGVLVLNARGLVERANPAACAMLALTLDEMMGRSPDQLFGRNHALMALLSQSSQTITDVRLPRRRLAQGIGQTLPDGERMVLLQDITERRDLEDRREALTRAIAHDLRNPISAIGGFIDLVHRSGELNDLQRKFTTRARQTVNKLNDMLTSLVDLAWIEAGMPMIFVPVALDPIIRQAIDSLNDLAARRGVGIVVSVQQELPPIMGDTPRLALAMHHLIQNAIQYTLQPEKNVVIHAWADDHEIYCNIADQGIGITEEEIKLIFDRMYRGRDERVAEVAGGGLGLTIARTIIRRHGGDLWASRNLQNGTTLSFVLPLGQS